MESLVVMATNFKRAQMVIRTRANHPGHWALASQRESLVHRCIRIRFTQNPQWWWLKPDQFHSHEKVSGGQPRAMSYLALLHKQTALKFSFLFCVMGVWGLPCGFPSSSHRQQEGCLAWEVPRGRILGPSNWCCRLGPHPVLGYNDFLTWGLSSGLQEDTNMEAGWPLMASPQKSSRPESVAYDWPKQVAGPVQIQGGKQTSSLSRKRADSHCQEALGWKGSFQTTNHRLK